MFVCVFFSSFDNQLLIFRNALIMVMYWKHFPKVNFDKRFGKEQMAFLPDCRCKEEEGTKSESRELGGRCERERRAAKSSPEGNG